MKTNLNNFQFAIFDVDGTLIKNKWLFLLKLMVRLNKSDSKESYLSWTGTKLLFPLWFQRFLCRFPRLNYYLDALLLSFLNLFGHLLDRGKKETNEGVVNFLSVLSKKGFLIFASSGNRTKKARKLLEETGIANHFTSIIGSEKIPKSEHIPYFAETLGLPTEKFSQDCLFFGDSPSDILIAKKWSVHPVGVENSINPIFLQRVGAREIINFKETLS